MHQDLVISKADSTSPIAYYTFLFSNLFSIKIWWESFLKTSWDTSTPETNEIEYFAVIGNSFR